MIARYNLYERASFNAPSFVNRPTDRVSSSLLSISQFSLPVFTLVDKLVLLYLNYILKYHSKDFHETRLYLEVVT